MGRVSDLLIEFEDIWGTCLHHAATGIEANLVEVVADPRVLVSDGTGGFVVLEETPAGWRLSPAPFFASHWPAFYDTKTPSIPVSPDFAESLKAARKAAYDRTFEEWVGMMEHGIRTGVIVVPGEEH